MSESDALVIVFEAADEVEALLHRELLEEAGIDVLERPFEVPWLETVKLDALHSQLLVRADDEARALQLLDAFRAQTDNGALAADLPNETDNESA